MTTQHAAIIDNSVTKANLISGISSPVYMNNPKYYEDTDTLESTPSTEATLEDQDPAQAGTTEPNANWEKRYSDLRSHSAKQQNEQNTKINELIQEIQTLKTTLKKTEQKPVNIPKSAEELEHFKENYPDMYDLVLSIAAKQRLEVQEEMRSEMEELKATTREIQSEKGWNELRKLHPDIDDIQKDAKFGEWFKAQPEEIRALINSPIVNKISRGIALYKQDAGIKTSKEEKLDASKAVKTSSRVDPSPEKKIWKVSEINKMSNREFQKVEKDIDLAMREGRVLNE